MDRRFLLSAAGGAVVVGFAACKPARAESRRLVGSIRTNWSRDPYAWGSYSYIARGASRRDVGALAAPVDGMLFFAGEAANPRRTSTVHAAYESGQRVAEFVLEGEARSVAIVGAGMSGLSAAHAFVRRRPRGHRV